MVGVGKLEIGAGDQVLNLFPSPGNFDAGRGVGASMPLHHFARTAGREEEEGQDR